MKALKYRLESGKVVNTIAEAINSKISFTTFLEEIPQPKSKMTPKQEARRIKL